MHSCPLADMICCILNASCRGKPLVLFAHSNLKMDVLKIIMEEGYINGFEVKEVDPKVPCKKNICVALKYKGDIPVIFGAKIVSKPGFRIYRDADNLPYVMSGMGTSIISTSCGVMCEKEARKLKIGGEVLMNIW